MSLILELYRQINLQLKGDEPYQVLLWNGKKCQAINNCNEDILVNWCKGYLDGIKLDPLWSSDNNAVAMLTPFYLLAKKHSFTGGNDSQGKLIKSDEEFIIEYKNQLVNLIENNYSYWQQEREEEITLNNQRYKRIKQRQSICPCGSYIKFNDCCYEEMAVLH